MYCNPTRLTKSAKNISLDDFKFTYDDCIQDALVKGYDQNADFYTMLLNNEDVRAQIASVFKSEIYRILRGSMIPIRRAWTSTTRLWMMRILNFRHNLSAIVWLKKPPRSGCANTWMRRIGTQVFFKARRSSHRWTISVFIRTISLRCLLTRLWQLDWN